MSGWIALSGSFVGSTAEEVLIEGWENRWKRIFGDVSVTVTRPGAWEKRKPELRVSKLTGRVGRQGRDIQSRE